VLLFMEDVHGVNAIDTLKEIINGNLNVLRKPSNIN